MRTNGALVTHLHGSYYPPPGLPPSSTTLN